MDEKTIKCLIEAALESRYKSYSPYSHYQVGAAVITTNGKIFQGANIENASYGATNCAERTALFKAVSEGAKEFDGIAIVGALEAQEPIEYAYPCGICRQVMSEFAGKDFQIIVAKSVEDYKVFTLDKLLPAGFGGDSIR